MARRKDELDEDERYRREEPVEAFHGGYMDTMGLMGADMLIPPRYVGEDDESGNPIPLGSDAENVRDDIPAAISKGEYVLPADVVKWYGLKGIIEFQNEARMGLMTMYADDLIQHVDEDADEGYGGIEDGEADEVQLELELDEDDFVEEDEEDEVIEVGKNAFRTTPKIAFIR